MNYTNLFFQAFIYLLATVISVPIAKQLKLGAVLGYLIAGVIIGPIGFNLVGTSNDVMNFAEFGVVMLLFIVGLELSPAMLWQLRARLFIAGGGQLILTTLAITLIAKMFGLSWPSSFTIGMTLSLSSTAIVLQILGEKGWLKSEYGKTIFSVLLFQDIAVIPILAIISLLSTKAIRVDSTTISGWQHTLLICVTILAIIIAGRFLVRPIFRFIAKSHLREVFTAFALLLVIGITLIMQSIGLSPALGTFIAGVMLADSEYRHELESNIEPFKGLLLGLFFISVGVSMDFHLIMHKLGLIISLVGLLLIVKFLAMFILGKIFARPIRNIIITALLLAQGGEFCFVLLSYVSQQEILTSIVAKELVAVVALSMLLTPLIILAYDKYLEPLLVEKVNPMESDLTPQSNPVIVAGFGRFGQILARILFANGFNLTVLDSDVAQIDRAHKFGYKVFYGDAERLELLEKAGIEHAKLFIIAIDNTQKAFHIAKTIRGYYPNLKMLIRVSGRTELYEGLHQGFALSELYRETFDSALSMTYGALQYLGMSARKSAKIITTFKNMDEANMAKFASLYHNKDPELYNHAREAQKTLGQLFAQDLNEPN